MKSLFDPFQLGPLRLANRIVMAPLTRNRAPNAIPTPLMADYYAQRASAGLIISEATAITEQAQGYSDVPGLYAPKQLEGWRRVTQRVHASGGRIYCQLWHVGRVSHHDLQPRGQKPVAPSILTARTKTWLKRPAGGGFVPTSEPRPLGASELPDIVQDFRQAARNAIANGFDGVEVHGANGYLLDQFLRTGANMRHDEYGGSVENRARLLLEVMRAVAGDIGGERVALRLSPVTPSNDIVDADPQPLFEYAVRQLAPMGLAYLHIIEGATGGAREIDDRPFDYGALRRTWRGAGANGAWLVNNGYDRLLAEQALEQGADLVAFGRSFIANADLVERLRVNAGLNLMDRATLYGGEERGYTDYPMLQAPTGSRGATNSGDPT